MNTLDNHDYINYFDKERYFVGRMVSNSKSRYRKQYPYNKVLFNANIFVQNINNELEKIWWGDIDLSLEGDILKKIAIETNQTFYIYDESSGRWEIETINIDKAFWNTNLETPYITEKIIKKIKKAQNQQNKEFIKQRWNNCKIAINKNKNLPILSEKKFMQQLNFSKKIQIPYDLLESEYQKIKQMVENSKTKIYRNKGKIFNEYFKEYGYFSYGVLEKYLQKILINYEKTNNDFINPCAIWLSKKSNKKIKNFDYKVEKLFNNKFTFKNFEREVTCNYCVPSIFYSNTDNINLNSYKNDIFYIRGAKID